jgi:hypothetical protein
VQPREPATNVASPPSAVGKEEGWRERAAEEVEEQEQGGERGRGEHEQQQQNGESASYFLRWRSHEGSRHIGQKGHRRRGQEWGIRVRPSRRPEEAIIVIIYWPTEAKR